MTDAWRRLAIGLAMLAPALQPAGVDAQGIALSLEDLSQAGRLQAGDGVIVTDVNLRRVKADVVGLSSDVLTVTDGRSEREFAEAGILKIDRQDSLMNGALLGLMRGIPLSGLAEPMSRFAPAGHLDLRLAHQPVRSMQYRWNRGRRDVLRAALIGAAVGVAVGFAYVKVRGCWSGGSRCGRAYIRYGGSFGLVGSGVGAAIGMR